jgi:carbohydrate-selective porin OprB
MATNMMTNRVGEQAVIAEIQRRGSAQAEPVSGRPRTVSVLWGGNAYVVRVKAKRRGTWQTTTTEGELRSPETDPTRFWVFVDLGESPPAFFIAPEWWVKADIHEAHGAYLARHGGHRAQNDESTHHSIPVNRIDQWRDRWDQLGLR